MKKSVVRLLSYRNFLAKFLYDTIFQKFLSQDMAFTFFQNLSGPSSSGPFRLFQIDAWMHGWMDGWRSTNHCNDSWMVSGAPRSLEFRCGHLGPMARFLKFFLLKGMFFIFCRFLFADLESFLDSKMDANIIFWRVFFDVLFQMRFCIDSSRFSEA